MFPPQFRPLFWDVGPADFEPRAYPEYTIGRVLEYGDREALGWLKGLFSEAEIEAAIRQGRLSRRSANFWALVYGIPREEVAALNRHSQWI